MAVRTRYFIASFFAALIFVGAMCGFILVDLSTDHYMPGMFTPMISAVHDEESSTISFFGYSLRIPKEPLGLAVRSIHRYRGIIPAHALFALRNVSDGFLTLFPDK